MGKSIAERRCCCREAGLSSIALHLARESSAQCVCAFGLRYVGWREKELACAARWQAAAVGVVEHHVVDLSLASWGGSSLTDAGVAIDSGDLQRTEAAEPPPSKQNVVLYRCLARYRGGCGERLRYI